MNMNPVFSYLGTYLKNDKNAPGPHGGVEMAAGWHCLSVCTLHVYLNSPSPGASDANHQQDDIYRLTFSAINVLLFLLYGTNCLRF